MNILFLTMNQFIDIEMHNIYSDLMKVFIAHGHKPYIVTPREQKSGEQTELQDYEKYSMLKVRIGNTSDVSLVKKGISTVTISLLYYRAVLKYLGDLKFDLILYSTPPITLVSSIEKLKKRFNCRTYLMLKDIFPQNAVDLGMFKKGGIIHRYFRWKEKKLYSVSDQIGCMSSANVEYLLKHNKEIHKEKVEICRNGIIPRPTVDGSQLKKQVRAQYGIPDSSIVFLYGGNLGKPQGVTHLLKCLKYNENKQSCFFIICGSGSEYNLIDLYIRERRPSNIKLINFLPKKKYDDLVAGCDVGLVFLDSRFTIPNYPSRILSYMENELPFIVCSDRNTDVGTEAQNNGYGLMCIADDPLVFTDCVNRMTLMKVHEMGKRSREYLEINFTADTVFNTIMKHGVNNVY